MQTAPRNIITPRSSAALYSCAHPGENRELIVSDCLFGPTIRRFRRMYDLPFDSMVAHVHSECSDLFEDPEQCRQCLQALEDGTLCDAQDRPCGIPDEQISRLIDSVVAFCRKDSRCEAHLSRAYGSMLLLRRLNIDTDDFSW